MHTQTHFKPEATGELLYEKLAVTREKYCPKERRVIRQMSKNSVNLEERINSDSSRISRNDSDGKEELGVQPYLYEPETNTEGNANITVLFYEITERVESKF